jgi:hypothetical protein
LNLLRSKLLNNQCRLNTRFLRIRHLDALHIEEDLVRAFQMEVGANDCLLDIECARRDRDGRAGFTAVPARMPSKPSG